jgi:hypothetical protein
LKEKGYIVRETRVGGWKFSIHWDHDKE